MKNRLQAPVLLSIVTLLGLITSKADAALLIGNTEGNNIVVFDESTGTFQGNFTTPGLGGLQSPDALTIGTRRQPLCQQWRQQWTQFV
jgi:hypothetical protein